MVEDDPSLGFIIKDKLSLSGYDTTLAENGEEGLSLFKRARFDLVVLDIMLPKKDGFSLAEDIRKVDSNIPILFLSAKSMLEDRLTAFSKGGDDYITKPFSMEELVMKIKVFLRRTTPEKINQTAFKIGLYTFDADNLRLTIDKREKTLTIREAEVLKLLCQNENAVVKREEILLKVWGEDDYFLGRSLDVFISRLRKYLDEDTNISIENIRGVGFRLNLKDTG